MPKPTSTRYLAISPGIIPLPREAVVKRVEQVVARLALFPGTGHSSDVAGVLVAPSAGLHDPAQAFVMERIQRVTASR